MAKRIVPPSIQTNELATLATGYLESMGKFFDMARREISKANSTDFDGIEFLVKGASAETFRFGGAISKMTNQHVGGELLQEGNEVTSTAKASTATAEALDAGGTAWARRFINTAGPEYGGSALREFIRDAELLFKGDEGELGKFYETLQLSCVVKKPDGNPILTDTFDDSLCRAQEFAAFLEGYSERIDGGGILDGETAGQTMAIGLLNHALMELNRQRDYADAPEAREAA